MGELQRFWKLPDEYKKVFLPIDQIFEKFLFEDYQEEKNRLYLNFFYALKPLIPRFLQILLRSIRAKSLKNTFPNWPIETYLEGMRREIIKEIKKLGTIPFIWFWPENKNFAICFTHDVETEKGLKNIIRICEIEKKFGFRSAFFFVAEGYSVSEKLIQELKDQGFEIGIHGLRHDAKLFSFKKIFDEQTKRIREYALKWDAKGFRSPSLLRNAKWMAELPFEYDSSFPDTDPYGPQPGGCLSIFPFFIGNVVELPVTLPQDHTLFVILKKDDITIWKEKIDWIEKMNGLASIIVHPDYFNKKNEKHYIKLLEYISDKKDFWHALPSEISTWWRNRDRALLVKDAQGNWTVSGAIIKNGITIDKISPVV